MAERFSAILAGVKDPRRTSRGNLQYSIGEIFFLVLTGVVCGCDSWEAIDLFGREKLDWFRRYFPYRKGTPSHDTLQRFFGALDAENLGECFISWAAKTYRNMDNELVAIDGKRICGSHDRAREQAAVHVVSAFADLNNLTLGQVATDEKSNEITAIPQLLDLIDVAGTVVSIDAMGTQVGIARKIRERHADYLLAVKGNQKELESGVRQTFEMEVPDSVHVWEDLGHGRIEERRCEITGSLKWIESPDRWPDLKTLVKITSKRTMKNTGETNTETRYYISSRMSDAAQFNSLVRSHWSIENRLHWVLDVTFREDSARKRAGNSALNFNMITKIAIRILAKNKGKLTKPLARLKAAVNDEYRDNLIADF